MRPIPVLVALAVIALAGCMRAPPAPNVPLATSAAEGFDTIAPGSTPAGWTVHLGAWGVVENVTDPAHLLVLRGAGQADPGLSSIVAPVAVGDFNATVAFKMLSGEHPQGAGLVFGFQDDENYQIVRYSLSENGWHLFTVLDGNRQKRSDASVTGGTLPQANEWVFLRVESRAGHVQAFDGPTKVIDYTLPAEAVRVGGVGPFVRGNTVAVFDDFRVEPA
ncbi:MAG TPA: hypothetical protein VHI93_00715 [Candidatus Thermoplasmatota archaeon]|nr:hypothetical protein [Candidatus Thermoplasmatota archaeon]